MDELSKRVGIGALVLGGIVLLASTLRFGTSGLGWTGGYGGMMGGYGGMVGGYGGMMGGYGGLESGWGILAFLSQIVFFLLLAGGVYLLYRTVVADSGRRLGNTRDDALEELRRAYARGEISDEEFATRRSKLRMGDDR